MSSFSAPYGIQPIGDMAGVGRSLRIPNGIANGLGQNIFKYQAVMMNVASGTIQPVTAANQQIFGVFAGIEYAPLGSRPTVSPFWASGTTYDTSLDFFAWVWPAWNPNTRWIIQADGSVQQTALASGFNFSNFANGNTSTGLGAATAAAAGVVAGAQAQMALIEFAPLSNNAIGDAFTDLIVGIAYPQVVSGFQTSVG
jgi:hypothetical protein